MHPSISARHDLLQLRILCLGGIFSRANLSHHHIDAVLKHPSKNLAVGHSYCIIIIVDGSFANGVDNTSTLSTAAFIVCSATT